MGSVYRGRHKIDAFAEQGGDVAIKSMKAEYATNPAFRERFIREAGLETSFASQKYCSLFGCGCRR